MTPESVDTAIRALVDHYRSQCLWFLREDYYPESEAERDRVLGLLERHGDVEAFRRVAAIRLWLSRSSSDASSAS